MRSISQIYSEAVSVRNNYLQFTELNSGRSNSKLSILNLMTYVMAVCIHTYEMILDVFQVRMAEVLTGRINGTPDWYARMAKKFQYNEVTEMGDEMIFNEDTLKIEYVQPDTSHRIVSNAAWQNGDDGRSLLLKICKDNSDSSEIENGTPYMKLSDKEMTAFKAYIQQVKFVGADIYCESIPGDLMKIVADEKHPIFYNDSYVTAAQALSEIKESMVNYVRNLEFNGLIYYQAILDVIRKTEHITDVSNGVRVFISPYNTSGKSYDSPIELRNRIRLRSGYISLMDENSIMAINSENITLIPASKMDEYLDNIDPDGCGCGCDNCQCNK